MNNPNKYIFACFSAEKQHHADMELLYRKETPRNDASLRYTSSEGMLTVLFLKNGNEEFYYKQKEQKGIGSLIQTITFNDNISVTTNNDIVVPQCFWEIATDYVENRKRLKIPN